MPTLQEIEAKVDQNRADVVQLAGSIFALVNVLVRVWQPGETWKVKEPTKGPDNILYIALQAHAGSATPPADDPVNWKVLDLNAEAVAAAAAQAAAEAAQAAAETAETNAETAEGNAAASATAAAGSATAAAASAVTAGNEATAAAASALAAAGSETTAAGALASFQNVYLGEAASDPAERPDATPLVGGELYFNTSSGALRVYAGSAWQAAAFDPSGAMVAANNLGDLTNVATARTNLGLAAVAASGAYADLSGAPALPTDFVSAASGGTFGGTIGVNGKVTTTRGSVSNASDSDRLVSWDVINGGVTRGLDLEGPPAADFSNGAFVFKTNNAIAFSVDGTVAFEANSSRRLKVLTCYESSPFTVTGTTPTLDADNGEVQFWTLTGASTPVDGLSNDTGLLLLIDDGTGFSVDLSAVVDVWIGDATFLLKDTGWNAIVLFRTGDTTYGKIVVQA